MECLVHHERYAFLITDAKGNALHSFANAGSKNCMKDQEMLLKVKEIAQKNGYELEKAGKHYSYPYPEEINGFLLNDIVFRYQEQVVRQFEYINLEKDCYIRWFYRDGNYRLMFLIDFNKENKKIL